MANSLGEKIRKQRKELNMTQSNLAGNEMTKSMLSQIENNNAMPSMKNLQYLASRLGKPASYFLEEDIQNDQFMQGIHLELKEATELMSDGKFQEAIFVLDSLSNKYSFDHDSKLYADFLSKYGECFIELNNLEKGKEKIIEAVEIYENKYLYIEAAKSYLLLIGIPWNNFDYSKCMEILEEAVKIYFKSINKDYSLEIEILYIRSILNAGLDQLEDSIIATTQALDISKRTKIYYRTDELYKNMAIMNFFMDKKDHFEEHLNKAKQFAAFTENKVMLSSIEGILGMYKNQRGEPERAIEHLEKAQEISDITAYLVYSEKAISYYLMEQYQLALDIISLMQNPSYIPFKYDYLLFWRARTYEALCLNKLNKSEKALEAVKQGIEMMEIVGESKTLAHAYRTLGEIYSSMGIYENAFTALKKANEIEEAAKANKLYY